MAFNHVTFAASTSQSLSATLSLRTCRVCKKVFEVSENHTKACRFHPSTWTGAERKKFYGRIAEPSTSATDALELRGIEYFYECCDAKRSDDPGCSYSFHRTYDE